MKMRYIIIMCSALLLHACSWLDVGSPSEIDVEDMFSQKDGYYTTLSGIYIAMGGNNLYGKNLPLYALEPLSQQYTVSNDNVDRTKWSKFDYNTDEGKTLVDNIWQTMYNTIVNCNLVIEKLQSGNRPEFEEDVAEIMLGEALGLRAYMYFDLLRLYGESMEVNPESTRIPFKTDFGLTFGERLSQSLLLERLMSDLQRSRTLLQADPILTGRTFSDRYVAYDRRQRMNYYAVTALCARIELYRKHYQAAADYAFEVIHTETFRFIRPDEILVTDQYGKEEKVDRVFMPEMLFALYTENILTSSRSTYEGLMQDFIKSTNCYEENDVRQTWFYVNPSANNKINLIRYQRSTLQEDAYKYEAPVVPLLKLSEMYLIAAEAVLADPTVNGDALTLLNTLKQARGISQLPATATSQDISTEITHEYICDFKGEGQLFYYYKRKNFSAIDDGRYGGNTVTVNAKDYCLPLPDYEEEFGYGSR